jgi:hypothetical protein
LVYLPVLSGATNLIRDQILGWTTAAASLGLEFGEKGVPSSGDDMRGYMVHDAGTIWQTTSSLLCEIIQGNVPFDSL